MVNETSAPDACSTIELDPSVFVARGAAQWLIDQIPNAQYRQLVAVMTKAVEAFGNASPDRLEGKFDLMFLAETLKESLPAVVDVFYDPEAWDFYSPPTPMAEFDNPNLPGAIHVVRGHNYLAYIADPLMQKVLSMISVTAEQKQGMLRRDPPLGMSSKFPMMPRVPMFPMDFLFLVMATEHALQPGQPARQIVDRMVLARRASHKPLASP